MKKQEIEVNAAYKHLHGTATGWYRVMDGDHLLYYGQSRLVAELLMNVVALPKK